MNKQKREKVILVLVALLVLSTLCLGWFFLSRTGFLILIGAMFLVGWLLQILDSKRRQSQRPPGP
jgi:Flp pilus assembly protein TadB